MELWAQSLPDTEVVEVPAISLLERRELTVYGSKMGHPEVLVLVTADRILVCRGYETFRRFLVATNASLRLKPWSICQFLRNGFVPVPYTVFENLYLLGTGDRLTVQHSSDLSRTVIVRHSFPFLAARSRGDAPAGVGRFRAELAAAVERVSLPFSHRVLMLSSGVDSVALALGLADSGLTDTRCVTYAARGRTAEHEAAAEICRRLGLRHEAVALADRLTDLPDLLAAYFRRTLFPCADPTLIAYLLCLADGPADDTVCLDGSGETIYGKTPSRSERIKARWNLSRANRMLNVRVPHYSRMSWFLRAPIDIYVRGYNLDEASISAMYGDAVDTERFWQDTAEELARLDPIDHRTVIRSRQYVQAQILHKVRLASSASRMTPGLPWLDDTFCEYMFNLPEECRFDRRGHRGDKMLLRATLAGALEHQHFVAQGFSFDLRQFCERFRNLIEAEVLECPLWTARMEAMFGDLYRALAKHRFAAIAIHDLFQLSAWINRSELRICR